MMCLKSVIMNFHIICSLSEFSFPPDLQEKKIERTFFLINHYINLPNKLFTGANLSLKKPFYLNI